MFRKDYFRNRRRIQSYIRRAVKKGFDVEFQLPKIPKTITSASVRRLKKITLDVLRKATFAPDLETGEKINIYQYKYRYPKVKSPAQLRELEMIPGETPFRSEISLQNVLGIIAQYPEKTRRIAESKIQSAITIYGERLVGNVLGDMLDSGQIIEPSDAYNYGLVMNMLNDFMRALQASEEEIREVQRDITDFEDSFEDYEGEFEGW